MKEAFFSVLVALGQLFVGKGLSTDVTLVGKDPFRTSDTVYVAAEIRNGHNQHMDDYIQSGLPLRVRYIIEVQSGDRKELIVQRYFFHEMKYSPAEKKYSCIRSLPGDTILYSQGRDCWNEFFATAEIAFAAQRLKGRPVYFSMRAFLEKTYIVPMQKTFNPMLFWGDIIPMYQGAPFRVETLSGKR